MSLLLRIAYDGTDFHGYARQASVRTVQGVLEDALRELYKQPVETRAASRTDAGVHATGQLVTFEPPFAIPERGVLLGLGALLPADVMVTAAWEQPGPVDVRGSNDGKRYGYRIRCTATRDPIARRTEWHLGRRLDLAAMRAGAGLLVGTHDFAAFQAADCQAASSIRTVHAVDVEGWTCAPGPPGDVGRLDERVPGTRMGPDVVELEVRGQAFLKNMVRIMVGTLVEIGLGRRDPQTVPEVLRSTDRRQAGMTAPAHGLSLLEVLWPRHG